MPEVDAVVLAGDIASHTQGLTWAAEAFPCTPVVYVSGNHEYYRSDLGLLRKLQATSKELGVHFLEQQEWVLGDVRFLGCTLWSGFDLYGAEQADLYMAIVGTSIHDYRDILTRTGKPLSPDDTLRLHRAAVLWLDRQLAAPFSGKTVVVTHFAPHRRCVAPAYRDSVVSPYFVTDLSWLMAKHKIDVWCHGHTHTNNDFIAENGCRVVSNQRGYPKEFAAGAMGFRTDLVIEV